MDFRFASPWALLALAAVPLIALWLSRRGGSGSVRFSSVGNARRAGGSLRRSLAPLPVLLRLAAVALLVVALARPQAGRERVREVTKGIAIQMVLDRSSSMSAEMEYRGMRLDRLAVVKKVFEEFVMGNGETLAGRPNDLVGMVAFARYADTMAPLTLGHGALLRFLEQVRIVTRRAEDGTAIGDAIALAAARLKTAEEDYERFAGEEDAGEYEITSKIIILLTDGQNNFGRWTPEEAARLAAGWGIKVYTIGVGDEEGVASVRTLLGTFKVPTGARVDTRPLRAAAETTGGIFRMAGSDEALREVYAEIDRLEKSEVESIRYVDYREMFVPFALCALLLVVLEVALSATVLRRIP
ncbi:MAG: VWA domain-containing protein [Candidatus Krumholzibacteria bacterium]|nr:VWA domain-containing protein [Candidatus Krumholzibacteria bacterium]